MTEFQRNLLDAERRNPPPASLESPLRLAARRVVEAWRSGASVPDYAMAALAREVER